MILQNKLGLTNEAELARAEEKISKTKALLRLKPGAAVCVVICQKGVPL